MLPRSSKELYPAPAQNSLQNNNSDSNAKYVMVPLPNYLPMLDDKVFICGVSKILWQSHAKSGLSCRQAGKLLGFTRDYYQKHLTIKKICSMKFLKRFQKHIDSEIFDKLYFLEKLEFTARTKRVFIPKELTPDLAYFVGYLQGDGCLTSDKKMITFSDEYIEQIEQINLVSEKLFGIRGHVYWKDSKISTKLSPCLEIKNVVLNSFIHTVFKINLGEKQNLKIPAIIKFDKELLRSYLPGLYDSDGTLPKEPDKAKDLFIDITMRDMCFIEEIKACLLLFGIETLKIYNRRHKSPSSEAISSTYEIRIRKIGMLIRFLREIGFKHPNKSVRSVKMLRLLKRAGWDLNPGPPH